MEKVLMAQSRLCSGQTLADSACRENTPACDVCAAFYCCFSFSLFFKQMQGICLFVLWDAQSQL